MANPFDQMAAEEAARQPAEAPRDNPFTAMAQQERAERDSAMRVALDQALRVMPEQAANDNQVAKGLGLPVALVERNRDETTRMWKARELQAAVSASPVLERQLFDPQFAKLAHDDVGGLSMIEKAVRQLAGGAVESVGMFAGGLGELGDVMQRRMAYDFASVFLPKPRSGGPNSVPTIESLSGPMIGEGFRAAGGSVKRFARESVMIPQSQRNFGYDVLAGLGQIGGQVAQTMALGPLGVLGLYAQGADQMAEKVAGDKADWQSRDLAVLGGAAITGVTEKWALDKTLGPLAVPIKNKLLAAGARVGVAVAADGGQEWTENVLQDAARKLLVNPEAKIDMGEALYEGGVGAAVGGIARTLVESALHVRRRGAVVQQKAQQAEAHGQLIQQLNELASASKVLARSPEDFQQFVKEASADSPLQTVYVDGNVLHQSGLAEPLAQAAPELAADIQQAVETGGAVAIPVDQYLTRIAPTPLAQQLADHLRTEPDGYSRAEAQQFMATEGERLQADLERTIADAEQGDAFRASADAVRDSIKSQLDTANRFRPEVNDAYSRIVGAYFATRAAQLGITPEELFKRYPLKVGAERIDGDQFDQGGLRSVDVFGNGSRVDHFDDAKRLMYSAQRFPAGTRWTVFEVFPTEDGGNQVLGEMFKYRSLDEAQAAVRGLRISATQKSKNAAKYGAIPNLWKGEEKKVAKALIDAGVGIERFASSTQSKSKYIYLESGLKVRLADHALPSSYDRPDVDYRYGGDIKALVQEVKKAEEGAPTPDSRELGSQALSSLRAAWQAQGIDAQVSERGGVITLSKIVVPESERGAGRGTAAMQALVGYADATGQHLALTPSADFGGNKKRLTEFYKRFGFVENKGKNRAFSTKEGMYRQAAGKVLYQSHQTASPEFKRWFGDSKVVDAEGKPLVVYHGTTAEISAFQQNKATEKDAGWYGRGIYFTADPDTASTYSRYEELQGKELSGAPLVMPVYVSIQNPYVWPANRRAATTPEEAAAIRKELEAQGHDGVIVPNEYADPRYAGHYEVVAFRPEQIKSATGNNGQFDPNDPNILHQGPRGSFSPEQLTISLLKGADLSTFLHESAHFFYENDIALAAQIAASQQQGASITAGEQQILADVGTLLTWHGLKGDVGAQLTEWYNLPFEQRRAHHERTAESFEAYLLEGKAPSIELAPYFQRFRSWLVRVYASLKDFLAGHPEAGTLTPEVRQVFDRMLATNDAIVQMEQARSMLPLFESAEQGGLSPEAWAQYQQDNAQQTQDAVQDLQARSLRDLQWARNARSRQLKRLQREANDLRKAAGVDAWREVMQQPVYRAWRFLTGKITEEDRIGEAPDASPQPSGRDLNPEVDSLLVAIAKLGGIARESAGRDLGVHADDQVLKGSVFGAPPFRKEGGLSADAMAERLVEHGYLLPDEHGKADLRELEELVTGELSGSPAHSVQWNLRSAMPEMKAGEQVADPTQLGAGRLDAASLGLMYGPSDARIKALKALRMVASKNAMHPDVVAELFGFDSGDALVQALLGATPLREAVGAATDQIMLERHGELATPEALEQAADRAVHNEARGRAVATELAALTKATGKPKLLADAARQFAAEAIARLKVRELIPSRFSNAQAKAARNAGDAMKAGDLARAAAEKRNELLQHYSARAAFDAREEVEKARKYLRKFDGEVKGLDPAYLSQITTLLGKYELRAHSLKDAERTVNLRAWVQSRLNDGEIPSLSVDLLSPAERAAYFAEVESRNEDGELVYKEDEDAIKLLADAIERSAKRSYKDLTVEEFRGLVDTVKNIEHLGRLKDTLLTARDQKSYEAVRNEMAAGIVAEAKTSGKNTPTATDWWGKKVQGIKGFLTSHIKAASWARVMDGGRDNGPVWRYLIQPANERATQETAEKAKATEDLSAILGPILKDASLLDKSGKGRYFPSIGRSLNLQGRLAVALNYGNESNLQRLLGGDGWTQEQIIPVLQSLTGKEWQAVQAVWDYLESYWPRIVAKELRVTGKAPERIPARAFTVRTADGQTLTLRGGYFPVVFDPRTNMKADADAKAQEAKEMQRAAYSSATTRRSFTKQRVEELHGRPLLLSLQGLYSGVNDVIHDLAWHEWVLDANKLLKSKTIDAAIREHYGPEVKHELEKWRDDVVMNQRRLGHATERFVGFARQNISAAALSFSVWSAIQQPLGLVNSGARIGWHWLGRGVADYIASPFATTREVMEKSAWMQNRTRTRFRELNELRNTVQGQTAAKELMGRYGYWMMVRMQLLVDIPTWRGAYAKAVAEGHDERTAVNLADQGVKDAQGGGEEVDQAGVERGSAYAKLFTVFYSYMGSTLNTAYTSAKTDKNKARAAANILLIVTVPAILQSLLRDALTPGDDDDPEKLAKKLAGEQLSFLFGLLVGGREFSQTAKGLFGGTGGFSGYSGPAGLRMVSDVDRLATQAKQGEFDEAFVKASISVLGDLSGLPSVQINRTITGVKAMAEGKTDNPLALAFGFQKQ